jgi:hypothetical protein
MPDHEIGTVSIDNSQSAFHCPVASRHVTCSMRCQRHAPNDRTKNYFQSAAAPAKSRSCWRHAPAKYRSCWRHAPAKYRSCWRHAPAKYRSCWRHARVIGQHRLRETAVPCSVADGKLHALGARCRRSRGHGRAFSSLNQGRAPATCPERCDIVHANSKDHGHDHRFHVLCRVSQLREAHDESSGSAREPRA